MKKLTFLVLLGVISFYCGAQTEGNGKVKWYTIEEAAALAKKEPKKLFIDVYTDWCGWCKVMDNKTFTHPVIAGYINKHFYPVKFNAETMDTIVFADKTFINEGIGMRSTHQLAMALLQGRMSYPSIVYMDENLQLLAPVPGYKTPATLEPILHFFAESIYKTTKWEDYITIFVGEVKE